MTSRWRRGPISLSDERTRGASLGARSEEPPVEIATDPAADTDSSRRGPGSSADVRTFLIADIRGYTKYTREQGDEAAAALASTFADLVRDVVEGREGSLIEVRGDEVLAAFLSARQALHAAVELQARFAEAKLPRGVGIGLDAGEAVQVGGGYRGTALNLAARLCGQAGPGQILASEVVVHLAARVKGLAYVEPSTFRLKGYAEPVRAFEVIPEERAKRSTVQRVVGRSRRAARRPAFWVAAAAATAVVVLLAVVIPAVVTGKPPQASSPPAHGAAPTGNQLVRFDPAFRKIVASIPVGKAPSSVTVGAGSIWVANSEAGSVSRIDPVTNKVTATIPVGSFPLAIAFDGSDVWVANYLGRSISRIDPGSNQVTATVAVDSDPVSLAFPRDEVLVGGAADTGAAGTGGIPPAPVLRIIPPSDAADQVTEVKGYCAYLSAGARDVWSVGDFGETVKLGETTTTQRFQLHLAGRVVGVLATGDGLWVATLGYPGQVVLVNPVTLRVTATVPVGSSSIQGSSFACPRSHPNATAYVSMAEDGDRLWVTNPSDMTLTEVDVNARRGIATVPVGNTPTGVATGFGSVWVTVGS